MIADSRAFGKHNSRKSRQGNKASQGNKIQHDKQQALALINQGRLQEAEAIYRRLIKQGAGNHLVFGNLGAICIMQGRTQEAITFLKQALAIKPDFPDALGNLGMALKEQGNLDAAVASYRQALNLKPNYPDALNGLGIILKEQGNLDAAVVSYRQALDLKPNYPEALTNLGAALGEQGNLDAAVLCFRQALDLKPDFPEALFNLGMALKEQDNLDAAVISYRQALDLKPDYPDALNNLGIALVDQGDLEAAISYNRKAVSLDHKDPDYHYNLSCLLLLSGDYDNGWEEYEWRLKKKDVTPPHAHPPVPQWNGWNHSPGETLMLVSEQGLGDILQFMRYVPYLKTSGLGMDVAFCAKPKLHGLILSSGITSRVHTPEEANAFTSGKWLPLLSLPRHLKVSPSQPLVQAPYIKAPAEKIHHWQERLATEKGPIIGIHWQGNRKSEKIRYNSQRLIPLWKSRSLPLEAFAPISNVTSATFLSLQKGSGSEQLDHCSFRHRFVACQEDINGIWDFVETAAMIANCDLIITNDTALAHLAGGMGQPTWLLLNKGSEWRWGMDGDSTFWHGSMHLFRQREWGNWAEVMDRVAKALEALPTKKAESLVPAKTTLLTTSLTPEKADGINNAQGKDEQRALALIGRGQLQEAEAIYRKLIQQGARSHLVFGNLGAICAMQGRTQEATTFLKEAVAINPHDSEALFKLGVAFWRQGDVQAAIDSYRKALALKPNYPEALSNLGAAFWKQGDVQAAIDSYKKALALKPDYPEALSNLGSALRDQGQLEAAIDSCQKALALKPDYPEALSNLGSALRDQGQLEAAIDSCQKALALKPDYPDALSNLGVALKEQGQLGAAVEFHRKAISLDADYALGHLNLSHALLLSGDYDNGWKEYRWRFIGSAVNIGPHARPKVQQWNGSNHTPGEQLIVVSEQGLGDTLQFMRYIPYLKTMGLQVCFCAQPNLHGLIQASGIATKLHEPEEANALATGKWVPLLSLPAYLNVRLDNPLIDTPYIKAPGQQVLHWKQKLAAEPGPIIGINWQASRIGSKGRSLRLEALGPITQVAEASLLSLQKGFGSEQLMDCPFRNRFVGCQEDINQTWDFVETAAIMANCDLIITVDTVVAHLAAGLGKPTWLLLKKVPDWRWGMEGDTTFWYGSMRLFRQRERGNWAEVMDHVVRVLKALPIKKAEPPLPAKMTSLATSLTPEKVDGINNAQHKDEQRALALIDHGQLQEAEAIYRKLIQQGVRSHLVFGSLGAICAMEGRTQEATTFFKQALAINPHDPEVLFNLGVSLLNQGELQAAIDAYRKAIALKPNFPKALFNLGNALKEQGRLEAAIDAYQKAIVTKPDYTKALFNLGNSLKEQGKLEAAINSYQKALTIRPCFPEALSNLGNVLKEQGKLEAAIDAYQKAIAIKPDHTKALFNLGNAFNDQGKLEAAIGVYRKALTLKPNDPDVLSNLGTVLHGQGELHGAITFFRKAISVDEKHVAGHMNLAHSLLLSGDYENGWKEYEWRHCMKEHGMCHAHPQVEQWNGHNLSSGEELVLVSEQGLGDTLQFMRYVYYLAKKGMNISFLCAQTKLHALMRFSGITEIYTLEECNQLTTGKWLSLLSLPQYLNVTPDNPLIDIPYIKVPEQKTLHWKQKLAAEKKPIIGINWQGSPTGQKGRALPLEAFAPITETINASLLSLQKGLGSDELEGCSFRNRFVGCQEEIGQTWDFVETAAIIANCDLIITVDTVVAHLAAGLGKPTWLLLQAVPEWRWGMDGDTTFWYRSMRLFRQRERGNWAEVMDRVARALEALPTKEAKSLVPTKTTSRKPGKADGINHAQHEDEQRALALIGRGQLQEAEAIYRKLIQQGARSHLVFGNLGAICAMEGRIQEATTFLKEALAIKPDFPDALANLGYALHQQGDSQSAINFCRKALAIKSDHPEALCTLGSALQKEGDLNAAIDAYRKALVFKPNYCNALTNLGGALQERDDLDAAINAYRKALAIEPNAPNTLNNLGSALGKKGDLQAAIDSCQKALALKPNYPEALSNLGSMLKKQGHLEAAIDACKKALAIKPDFPDALSNLGNALKDQGQLDAAIDSYRKALAIKPDYTKVLFNLAFILQEKGDLPAAVELNKKAVSLDPGYALGHLNLSIFLLLSGDYGDGWKEYRWRFAAKKINPHACPKVEQWNGGNHTPGEQLIVVSEQGLGDTLQFMRYIPCLKTMGLEVCFCAQPNLHGLIQASGMTTRLCEPEEANALTTGKWVPLLSLPAYLNVRPGNPLIDTPYIKAPGQQVLHWKQKLTAEHGPIIGLNWQGNPRAENGHLAGRSLPLEAFAPITQVTGAGFLSLQKGSGSEQLMDCPFRHRFVDCQEDINETWDFVETAAIMANCDLIITVDTAVAHLAAGLGRPTWLLLKKVPDWRWGMEGDTTFWYGSMRLFRQRERGNWAEVMDRVARALEASPVYWMETSTPATMTSIPPGKPDGINKV